MTKNPTNTKSKVTFCLKDDEEDDSDRYTSKTDIYSASSRDPYTRKEQYIDNRREDVVKSIQVIEEDDIDDDKIECINKFVVLPLMLFYFVLFAFFSVVFSLSDSIVYRSDEHFILSPFESFDRKCFNSNALNYQDISNNCKDLCDSFTKDNSPCPNDENACKRLARCEMIYAAIFEPPAPDDNIERIKTEKVGN